MSWLSWPVGIALVSAVSNAVIGVLAYVRSRGKSIYLSLALISLCFSMWSLSYIQVYPGFDDPFWMRMMFTPLALLPGAGLSFVWIFTGIPEGVRRLRTVPLYGAGIVLIGLLWSEKISLLQFRAAFIFGGLPIFGVGLGLLALYWRQAEDASEKNRRGYLLAAFLIAIVGGLTDFLPTVGIPFLAMANVSLMVYSLIVLTAIEKHYLLDLRSAARRALVLLAASSLLAGLMTGLAWLTRQVEGELFLNFFLLSLGLVVLLPLVWERVNRAFNQLVFLRQAGQERAVERFESGLEAAAGLDRLEGESSAAVRKVWGAQSDLVWVRGSLRGIEPERVLPDEVRRALGDDPSVYTVAGLARREDDSSGVLKEYLESAGRRAIAPVLREGQLVGALLLGPASQGFYDLADLRTLRRICVSAGRAVKGVELTREIIHADRLKQMGTLAAGIAHEVRNPLSCILGAVELLTVELPAEKRDECLHILKEEVLRLNEIVSELVDYSSPKSRSARVEWKKSWLAILRLLRTDIPPELSVTCEGEAAELGVSEGHLKQIFINLVKNAVRAVSDAGAKGKVLLWVRCEGEKAVLELQDNGPGIPEDVLPRLFIPFESRSAGGTGLGLAMVRRLAELYGGRAWAENQRPGPGAKFVVELPLASSRS